MPKIVFILFFCIVSSMVNAQIKAKTNHKKNVIKSKSIDSCLLLKNLLLKNWRLDENKQTYIDSLKLFSNGTFINCLLNKTKSEIIKILGVPIYTVFRYNEYNGIQYVIRCTNQYYIDKCTDITLEIIFDEHNRAKSFGDIYNCQQYYKE